MSAAVLALLFVALVVALFVAQRRAEKRPALPPPDDDVEDAIDLHGFLPRDIPSVVEEYLEVAAARGLREVRLIHGRGKGVQRARVQEILAAHPLVERYANAPAHRGGWGATIAWLRPPPSRTGRDDRDEPPV
jgi:DNA-nicking Smr family endonuclease